MKKGIILIALVLNFSAHCFACIGDPESISLKRIEALLEGLRENKEFLYAMGSMGEIKNINFNSDLVTISLETYTGEKNVLVYKTVPVNIPMGDPNFVCDKREAELIN